MTDVYRPGDFYEDDDGRWQVLSVHPDGRVLGAALVSPSVGFEERRKPIPPSPPSEQELALRAIIAKPVAARTEAENAVLLDAVAKRAGLG